MKPNALLEHWQQRLQETALCIGLDPDPEKLPAVVQQQEFPIFTFNQAIIDATHDLVCAYKPQFAHYAACGAEDELEMTIDYLTEFYPETPVIFDGKRGDVEDTAQKYAIEAFERYGADALTVNPYIGPSSIKPYLTYEDTAVFLLCHTSNPDAAVLQNLTLADGKPLYHKVIEMGLGLRNPAVGFVVGATHLDIIREVRRLAPGAILLIPGIGTQGGNYQAAWEAAGRKNAILSASRQIIHASSRQDFAKAARAAAQALMAG